MTMKTLLNVSKIMLVLVLTGFCFTATAGENMLPDVIIKKVDNEQKVSVTLNNLKSDAYVRIVDERGVTLIEEELEAVLPSAAKVFNLELLPAGAYDFIISTGKKETVQPVEVLKDDILIKKDQRQVYLVPTIKIGEDFVDVSWLNGKVSNMKVEIARPDGERVFEDEISNVIKVERRYNLKKLSRGEYTMIVTTPYKTHYQQVIVE